MPAPITGDFAAITQKLKASIGGWQQRVGLHWPRLQKALGEYMARTVRANIRLGGRPDKFKPLKGKRKGGKPLWDTGQHIMARVKWEPFGSRGIQIAQFGSAPDGKDVRLIGEVHHYGTLMGSQGKKGISMWEIPARPWLLIPDSEVPGMDKQVTKWVEESIWQKPGSTTP